MISSYLIICCHCYKSVYPGLKFAYRKAFKHCCGLLSCPQNAGEDSMGMLFQKLKLFIIQLQLLLFVLLQVKVKLSFVVSLFAVEASHPKLMRQFELCAISPDLYSTDVCCCMPSEW